MDVTHIDVGPFVLRWSEWHGWRRLERDARSDPLGVRLPDGPGVYEAKLRTSVARLTIGKASNLRMRVKQGLVKGKLPHPSGKHIRATESTVEVVVRWAETDRPSCAEEELHRRHIEEHGGLPKYTKHT